MKLPTALQQKSPSLFSGLSKTLDQLLMGNVLVYSNMTHVKEKSAVSKDLFPTMTLSVYIKDDGKSH